MNRRQLLEASVATVFAQSLLTACVRATTTLRYRLKIIVKVGAALREGSSVIGVRLVDHGENRLGDIPRFVSVDTRGEAVVVDLGEQGLLFGLLEPSPAGPTGFYAKGVLDVLSRFLPPDENRRGNDVLDRVQGLKGEFDLPVERRPVLVRFGDVRDPASIQLVEVDHFARVFGPGIVFQRSTISVTNAPVTVGIDERLPWLHKAKGNLLSKKHRGFVALASMTLAEQLSPNAFKRTGEAE